MKNVLRRIIHRIRGEVDIEELCKLGLKVGENLYKDSKTIIDPSWCWLVTIGNNVTLAPKVHILAHDASTKKALGYTKIGLVIIEDNVFIGANSTVMPNVVIGKNSIIGAHSLVTHNIPPNSLAVGVPAKVIGNADDYIKKYKKKLENGENPIFEEDYTIQGKISNQMKEEMKESLKGKIGFVR